jgi:prepilin-type N-terminal cleavage/methylation domain-containing protein
MKRNQSGFTLIEIAIVLVIIGLLLGGVLKGQELINSAKVKNLAGDFKNIPVFIYGYQDKFRALPGDDRGADTHLGALAKCAGSGNACPIPSTNTTAGDGIIGGAWDSPTSTDESFLFWQHVRLAGFSAGSTDITAGDYHPVNSLGGAMGIQSNSGFTTITKKADTTASAMTGAYVLCSKAILGKFAKQLDTTLDNGDTDTGAMRVLNPAVVATSIATSGVTDGDSYTVCMGI